MYLKIGKHKEAIHYIPLDLDTKKTIRDCIWADDETGKYCVYEKDYNGSFLFITDDLGRELNGENRQLKTSVKKGRIRLIDTRLTDG